MIAPAPTKFQNCVDSVQPGQIGPALINDNLLGNAIVYDGLLEKSAGRTQIPSL